MSNYFDNGNFPRLRGKSVPTDIQPNKSLLPINGVEVRSGSSFIQECNISVFTLVGDHLDLKKHLSTSFCEEKYVKVSSTTETLSKNCLALSLSKVLVMRYPKVRSNTTPSFCWLMSISKLKETAIPISSTKTLGTFVYRLQIPINTRNSVQTVHCSLCISDMNWNESGIQ